MKQTRNLEVLAPGLDWENILKEYCAAGLRSEDAESLRRFIKKFIEGGKGKALQKKGCDLDFVTYLFFRYGFVMKGRSEKDLDDAIKGLEKIPSWIVEVHLGKDKDGLLKKFKLIKESGSIYPGPVSPLPRARSGSKGGRPQELLITEFIYFLKKYLKSLSFTRKGDIDDVIVDILGYFPPWVKGRTMKGGEYDRDMERLKRYLKKKEPFLESRYELLITGGYDHFKMFWDLPETIRKGDVQACLDELRRRSEQLVNDRKKICCDP